MPPKQSQADILVSATGQEKTSGFLLAMLVLLGSFTLFLLAAWLSQPRSEQQRPVSRVNLLRDRDRASGSTGSSETAKTLEELDTDDEPLPTQHAAELLTTVSSLVRSELASIESSAPKGKGIGDKIGDEREKGPGPGGEVIPSWERWQIRFSAATLQEYAAMLDYFDVELGVVGGGQGRIDYARNLSHSRPDTRQGNAAAEKRLRFVFHKGGMKDADRALADKAGLSTSGRVVCQFYPLSIQNELEALERQALGTRPLASVRRTVFGVLRTSSGHQFFVERVEPELPSGGLSPL